MFSHVKKWDSENIKNNSIINSRKYKLEPTKSQKIILNKAFNDCRYTYNRGVEMFNNDGISNFMTLRDYLVTKKETESRDHIIPYWFYSKDRGIPESVYETAKSLRANTLKRLSINIKSAFSNLKNKNIKYFKIRYKSKKKLDFNLISDDSTNCKINKEYNKYTLSISKLKNIKIKVNKNEKLSLNVDSEISILKTNIGYYLILPQKMNKSFSDNVIKSNNIINVKSKKDSYKICALDPGLRSLLTGIDLDGNIFNIGENVLEKLNKIKIDKSLIYSKYSKLKKIKNKSYKEYKRYIYYKYNYYIKENKLKNYIKELHHQASNYLVSKYDKIILPKFGTQKMVKSGQKAFNKMILSLNHFSFKQLLINKCIKFNKTLIEVSEAYTSVTCSNCSNYKLDLGANKIYNCNACKKVFDRDENASYNILKNVISGNLPIYNIY